MKNTEAKSPPGWEDSVKRMKKHPEIDNPWALAWHMKNKGNKPHKKKKDAMSEVTEFQDALIARRVIARVAKVHPTDKAKNQYLRDHPKADPAHHTVEKKEKRNRPGREKGYQLGRAQSQLKRIQEALKEDEADLANASGREREDIQTDIDQGKKNVAELEGKIKGFKADKGKKPKKDSPKDDSTGDSKGEGKPSGGLGGGLKVKKEDRGGTDQTLHELSDNQKSDLKSQMTKMPEKDLGKLKKQWNKDFSKAKGDAKDNLRILIQMADAADNDR